MEYFSHDLKTERREASPGLAAGMKLVPILFYCAIIGCSAASVWFYLQVRDAEAEISEWNTEAQRLQTHNITIAGERSQIQKLNDKAETVSQWVSGSVGIQPLAVAISRSMGEESTVADLLLERKEDNASQIHMSLKMDGATASVLDETLQSVRDLNFRPYGASQVKDEEFLDYNATLVWQNFATR